MKDSRPDNNRIRMPASQSSRLVFSYIRGKIREQIPSVLFIVAYLLVFQVFVLGQPVEEALILSVGIVSVILGLSFFLEGLSLGLMPLGQTIGLKLPKRSPLWAVLVFAFLLGFGTTFAEPAVAALKTAGSAVKAWDAPLLYLVLNRHLTWLILSIGAGVGLAVVLGMLRFFYNWSLKPLVTALTVVMLGLSALAWFKPNLMYMTGLAWDCGAVTTGPVTVPLVLALGLGISRVVGKRETALSGFGVVALASALPIITVLLLGFVLEPFAPKPMTDVELASASGRTAAAVLFSDDGDLRAYVIRHGSPQARLSLFDGNAAARDTWYHDLDSNPMLGHGQFGSDREAFRRWLATSGTTEEQIGFFGSANDLAIEKKFLSQTIPTPNIAPIIARLGLTSVQAVLPLCLFLFGTLFLFLRERLQRPDEVIFGVAVALFGMFFLNVGIELGLSRLGGSVGSTLPETIRAVEIPSEARVITPFDSSLVQTGVNPDGTTWRFFYLRHDGQTETVPFNPEAWHPDSDSYDLVPRHGPLLGGGGAGLIILLLFAFFMGFGATMAEPALMALGRTVEEITIGIFRGRQLIRTVAIGVGIGISFGVLKIVFNLPLIGLLVPPYALLLVLTLISDESYVNIAWDSAGVTTGPVTVPLVLAMGLGLGSSVGAIEGFGVLALASVYPALTVLAMGVLLKRQQRQAMQSPAETGGID